MTGFHHSIDRGITKYNYRFQQQICLFSATDDQGIMSYRACQMNAILYVFLQGISRRQTMRKPPRLAAQSLRHGAYLDKDIHTQRIQL